MSASFEDSFAEFRQFLSANGYADQVIWLTPDDVILTGRRLVYLRVQSARTNEESARRLFQLGISKQTGVLWGALCEREGATYAYVWVPRDEREAETHLMAEGLKMSVRAESSRLQAKPIRNPFHWRYLRFRYRKEQKFKEQLFQ